MAQDNYANINSKSVFRIATVLEIEDNLPTSSPSDINRNSFGRRIKVKFFEDKQNMEPTSLPWVFPALPKHLQITPKVGETVLVFTQNLDDSKGNRFYLGPIISQDYYLDHGGKYEALSLLQGDSTKPLCHPLGNPDNDGTYPDHDVVAIQGRGDSAMWLKDEELRLMCGHKPQWKNRSFVERADPGSLLFNKKDLGYIQLKYGEFQEDKGGKVFHSVANVVADRINLISHNGADSQNMNVTDQQDLMSQTTIETASYKTQGLVYGEDLIQFLAQFREVFKRHTHHWTNDPQVICEWDANFWNKDLNELLCKTIRIL